MRLIFWGSTPSRYSSMDLVPLVQGIIPHVMNISGVYTVQMFIAGT